MTIKISELGNPGDARGLNFSLPTQAMDFLGRVADVHFSTAGPEAVRGNHYHVRKRRAIIALPGPTWSLHWDNGEGTATQHRAFDGRGAVLVLVPPGSSHALRNDGVIPLLIVACSSDLYDPTQVVARRVV
jgi:oxalate decarboxylase/phosphoglucose isomerase-like protein (cupin superfamily)